MARLTLVPQRREFFELYNRAAANAVEIARLLVELLERFPDGAAEVNRDIKELEHEGDRLTHEVVDLLNRTFVTPFDRDDMYRLARPPAHTCHHLHEAAGNTLGYRIEGPRPPARGPARARPPAPGKLA